VVGGLDLAAGEAVDHLLRIGGARAVRRRVKGVVAPYEVLGIGAAVERFLERIAQRIVDRTMETTDADARGELPRPTLEVAVAQARKVAFEAHHASQAQEPHQDKADWLLHIVSGIWMQTSSAVRSNPPQVALRRSLVEAHRSAHAGDDD
jgi:hypothetical protein